MRNFVIDTETYSPWNNFDRKDIPSECNDITFINNTDGVIAINNFPIAINGVLSSSGNQEEMNKTKYNITNISSTSGALYVLRKRFIS
jgi:hypothetical protein